MGSDEPVAQPRPLAVDAVQHLERLHRLLRARALEQADGAPEEGAAEAREEGERRIACRDRLVRAAAAAVAAGDARVQRGAAVAVVAQRRLDTAQSVGVRIRRLAEAAALVQVGRDLLATLRRAPRAQHRRRHRHRPPVVAAGRRRLRRRRVAVVARVALIAVVVRVHVHRCARRRRRLALRRRAAQRRPRRVAAAEAEQASRVDERGGGRLGVRLGRRRRLLVRRFLRALGEQRECEGEAEAQRVRALAPQRAAERILVARLAVEFVEQHVVELTDRRLPLAHARAVDGGARRRRRARPQRAVAHARIRSHRRAAAAAAAAAAARSQRRAEGIVSELRRRGARRPAVRLAGGIACGATERRRKRAGGRAVAQPEAQVGRRAAAAATAALAVGSSEAKLGEAEPEHPGVSRELGRRLRALLGRAALRRRRRRRAAEVGGPEGERAPAPAVADEADALPPLG